MAEPRRLTSRTEQLYKESVRGRLAGQRADRTAAALLQPTTTTSTTAPPTTTTTLPEQLGATEAPPETAAAVVAPPVAAPQQPSQTGDARFDAYADIVAKERAGQLSEDDTRDLQLIRARGRTAAWDQQLGVPAASSAAPLGPTPAGAPPEPAAAPAGPTGPTAPAAEPLAPPPAAAAPDPNAARPYMRGLGERAKQAFPVDLPAGKSEPDLATFTQSLMNAGALAGTPFAQAVESLANSQYGGDVTQAIWNSAPVLYAMWKASKGGFNLATLPRRLKKLEKMEDIAHATRQATARGSSSISPRPRRLGGSPQP